MVWFWDRLFLDFEIEFLSISSLWISVDMGLFWDQISFFWKMYFFRTNENLFSKISNSRIIRKKRKFWSKNIFDPLARKIVIQNRRHDSALSLFFPPKHIGPGYLPLGHYSSAILSAFFGFGYVLTIQEVILCVICVSFKNSLFFEANYRFDKHSGFHVCLAKTFSITVLTDTSVSKGELPKNLDPDAFKMWFWLIRIHYNNFELKKLMH